MTAISGSNTSSTLLASCSAVALACSPNSASTVAARPSRTRSSRTPRWRPSARGRARGSRSRWRRPPRRRGRRTSRTSRAAVSSTTTRPSILMRSPCSGDVGVAKWGCGFHGSRGRKLRRVADGTGVRLQPTGATARASPPGTRGGNRPGYWESAAWSAAGRPSIAGRTSSKLISRRVVEPIWKSAALALTADGALVDQAVHPVQHPRAARRGRRGRSRRSTC